ncbi:MAG: hypothetical protein M1831_002375 [Alyxoria varia]|nr:MAG: hypothetical protein M1831_002375 [Alyxoria varia]
MSTQEPDPTLHLPRLLCLHGGGVSASIFRLQMRAVYPQLRHKFRLVYADGPWLCEAGPGILPVFEGAGPFRRWLRYLPNEHADVDDDTAMEEVEYSLRSAMEEDSANGADGEWVGLVGFSQGATIVDLSSPPNSSLSILFDRQVRLEQHYKAQASTDASALDGMYGGFDATPTANKSTHGLSYIPEDPSLPHGLASGRWRFAIALAGRAGLVKVSPLLQSHDTLIRPSKVSEGPFEYDRISIDDQGGFIRMFGDVRPGTGTASSNNSANGASTKKVILMKDNESRIWMPTLHVHGLLDPGLPLHREMVQYYCNAHGKNDAKGPEVVEWEGEHRLPLKTQDTTRVAEEIVRTATVRTLLDLLEHLTDCFIISNAIAHNSPSTSPTVIEIHLEPTAEAQAASPANEDDVARHEDQTGTHLENTEQPVETVKTPEETISKQDSVRESHHSYLADGEHHKEVGRSSSRKLIPPGDNTTCERIYDFFNLGTWTQNHNYQGRPPNGAGTFLPLPTRRSEVNNCFSIESVNSLLGSHYDTENDAGGDETCAIGEALMSASEIVNTCHVDDAPYVTVTRSSRPRPTEPEAVTATRQEAGPFQPQNLTSSSGGIQSAMRNPLAALAARRRPGKVPKATKRRSKTHRTTHKDGATTTITITIASKSQQWTHDISMNVSATFINQGNRAANPFAKAAPKQQRTTAVQNTATNNDVTTATTTTTIAASKSQRWRHGTGPKLSGSKSQRWRHGTGPKVSASKSQGWRHGTGPKVSTSSINQGNRAANPFAKASPKQRTTSSEDTAPMVALGSEASHLSDVEATTVDRSRTMLESGRETAVPNTIEDDMRIDPEVVPQADSTHETKPTDIAPLSTRSYEKRETRESKSEPTVGAKGTTKERANAEPRITSEARDFHIHEPGNVHIHVTIKYWKILLSLAVLVVPMWVFGRGRDGNQKG